MSIPAVLGANLLGLVDAIGDGVDWSLMPAYLAGMAVAAVTGIASIRLLRSIASRGRFGGFAYYCWVLGVLAIILTMIFQPAEKDTKLWLKKRQVTRKKPAPPPPRKAAPGPGPKRAPLPKRAPAPPESPKRSWRAGTAVHSGASFCWRWGSL
jgi:hypothetical protein